MAEAIDRRAIQEALECIRVNRAHQQDAAALAQIKIIGINKKPADIAVAG